MANPNPYAPPIAGIAPAQPTGPATINGATLVLFRGSSLPALCLKCGERCDERREKRFVFVPKETFFLLALGLLPALLVYFTQRKSATLSVPLCGRCLSRWRTADILGAVAVFAAVVAIVGLFALSWIDRFELGLGVAAVGVALALAGVSYGQKVAISTTNINADTISLIGVDPRAAAAIVEATAPA